MKILEKALLIFAVVGIAACAGVNTSEGDPNKPGPESLAETALSDVSFWYANNFVDFSETQELIVEQELKGVTVEMMNWWWDNINTTARYRTWHPNDHIYFKWVVQPEKTTPGKYTPGAVQEVRERIAGIPATLLIKWEPYDKPGYSVTETNYIKASARLKGIGEEATQLFLHEYHATENGILLRSVFNLPADSPSILVNGLNTHCNEEMQYLAKVLPNYYKQRNVL